MFKLKEKYFFPEQYGLFTLLRRHNGDGPTLDSYYEGRTDCDLALSYDPEFSGKNIISFHSDIYHPIRPYMDKWDINTYSERQVKWSKILNNNLAFYDYSDKVIVRDFSDPICDLRLAIHSLEHQIPVISDGFCPRYYDGLATTPQTVASSSLLLKQPRPHLSEDAFIHNLIYIIGRYVTKH